MPDLPVLDAVDQRILGSLLEKERTVPASYPLSLNALSTACNQTSSRDPLVEYDEQLIEERARDLKQRGLLRIVWADTGRRTLRYHQTLSELLELPDDERALLTVLLLRGAQAAGELRGRTDRLHGFAERADVEACLQRMAAASSPLVRQLERRPGQHDPRWVHLLGGTEEVRASAPAPASSGESGERVLDDGRESRDRRVRAAYDAVAGTYADQLADELDDLPFETWLLDRAVASAGARPVVEVGCGPGHVSAYLAMAGADATGLDLSPGMVEQARLRFPDVRYEVGDLTELMRPPSSAGWGAVLAWYSLIHLAPSELPSAVAGLVRPLADGGWLVVALHAGSGVRHADSWFEHDVDLDFVLHDPRAVCGVLGAAGLVDVEWYQRGSLTWRGESTDRLYALARKPD